MGKAHNVIPHNHMISRQKTWLLQYIKILSLYCCFPGKTQVLQNGFELESVTLDKLPLAFYNDLFAYAGW